MRWRYAKGSGMCLAGLAVWVLVCLPTGYLKPEAFGEEAVPGKKSFPLYNDSFDTGIRGDLWEKTYRPRLGPESAMPQIRSVQGRLRISTMTGGFSNGGLGSRYTVHGDFDIQVDVSMAFLENKADMDQVLILVVEDDKTGDLASIGLAKLGERNPNIYSWHREKERAARARAKPVGDFRGSLRIVREGSGVRTLYREQGATAWEELESFRGLAGDVAVALVAKNFSLSRKSIQADAPVVAEFDNFTVNAAQGILLQATQIATLPVSTGCDKAPHYLWEGKTTSDEDEALAHYLKAIELCPGFIRPYELAGNLYRKKGLRDEAIAFFEKAADLGTVNYKLYFLLASLLFEKGEIDEANRHLERSLHIRGDYPQSLDLKARIEKATDHVGPKLFLFEPATQRGVMIVHRQENLTVRGLAVDKSGIAWVRINGQEAELDAYGNFIRDVPVHAGENVIRVEAEDKLGNPSSLSVNVQGKVHELQNFTRIESPEQAERLYENSHAIVIGINDYDKWPTLEYAVADAMAVKQKLEQTGFRSVSLILNKEATQRRILSELFNVLPQKAGRNDRVVFYFAGHGQTEDLLGGGKRGYIIPVDADLADYPSTAISMEQIRSLSRRIPAKHIFYIMDSCYSGLGFSRSAGASPKISDYLRKISSMRAVQVVTAGGKGEQVQEREGHGLFTTYFLRALDGEADFNKDHVVTGSELGAYIRPAVSNASAQAQTPLYGRLEGEGEFLFFVSK